METKKYYYEDSFQTEMRAVVISCEEGKTGYRIALDGTVFFPEGGGQGADTGTLTVADTGEVITVTDVHEKDGRIWHYTDKPIVPGTRVSGMIDWKERFSRMQNHSGEHLVSGIIHSKYQYNNVGFHLGREDVTIDFDGPLTREQFNEVEQEANEAVFANLPIEAAFPSKEVLSTLDYRSKIEIQGDVRIVTIPGYDTCACCAPHVKRTGEIGIIKFLDTINYKGGVRVHMLCGRRALFDYEMRYEAVARISGLLSAKQTETPEAVIHMKEEVSALKEQIGSLNQLLIAEKLKAVDEGDEPLCLFEDQFSGNDLRRLVDGAVKKRTGVCCGLYGNDEKGYQFVLGGKNRDMRAVSKAMFQALSGRGGGSAEMVQGMLFAKKDEIRTWFEKGEW